MTMTFSSTIRMWEVSGDHRIVEQGIDILKTLAAFGGIVFTAGFLISALRLVFAYSGEQRAKILKHMAFTAIAAFIHYSAWQIAPRMTRIFFFPMNTLTVPDRTVYIVRWIASLGGFVFTLSFMCLGIYAAFVGIRPHYRMKFYSGMVSTLLGAFIFYSAWMFAPIIAQSGLQEHLIEDKPIVILELIGSMGSVLFTFAFMLLSLYLGSGTIRSDRKNAAYLGLTMSLIGALLFYSAWQFAPAIANALLPPPCESLSISGRGC
jgi:hypothetical protein